MKRNAVHAVLALSVLVAALMGNALGDDGPGDVLTSGFDSEFGTLSKVTHSKADPADRWMRDNYGDNITRFIRDTRDPHAGQSCLKMSCLRYDTGAAATLSPRFHVEKGKKYVLRLWLKARSLPKGRSVFVRVRNAAVQDATPAPGEKPPAKWSTHAKRRCSVSGEWQEFTLDIEPEYDADVEIQLGYESVGTLWVDDVSVSEGSVGTLWQPAPPSDAPPQKGNLIYNGSFEVGPSGWGPLQWTPLERSAGDRHRDVTVDKIDDAPNGECALRVDSTEWIESEFVKVRPGQQITVSAYIKVEKDTKSVQLSFLDGSMVKYCEWARYSTSCNVTSEWQRFSVSGRLPASADNGLVVRIWGGGVFLVDAVQVEEGDLSPFNIGADLEVGAEKIDTDTGIYRPGETSKVRVLAHGKAGATVDVESRLEDYYGATREVRHSKVKLDAKGDGSANLDIALRAPGIYRLVSDAKGTRRPAEIILAQVKKAAAPYGGIHATVSRFSLDFVKDMGFGWWRLHDHANPVMWNRVEPEKGKLTFDDEAVNQRLSTGVKILGCLYSAPGWAQGKDPGNPDSVTTNYFGTFSIEEWKKHVREVVGHFKDRIHHWEVWNEPGKGCGFYFKLLKAGYETIKEVDPDAFVVGGGGLHWSATADLEKFFDMGALEYMDAYSFHGYPQEGRSPWTYGEGIVALMKKHGKVVPFWDSEWGVQCFTFRRVSAYGGQSTYRWMPMPYRTAVNMVLRHAISERAIGVEADFWYTLGPYHPIRDNSGGLMTLIEYDGSPRATVPAVTNTWDLLGQAELVERLAPSDAARIYTFKRPDGALWVVDAKMPQGMSAQVVLPLDRQGERVNAMGDRSPVKPVGGKLTLPVCDEPLFVLFEGAAPEEVARAARAARFQDMPPAGLLALLAIDRRNQTPELLRDARYLNEVKLGFGLNAWLLANGKGKILVFAGDGPPSGSKQVSITDPRVTVFDSLGDEVRVEDGRIEIANRAPYYAVGEHPEKSVQCNGAGDANLLKNPSFEQGENGRTPADWSEWKRFSGESTFVKAEGGRTPESKGMAVVIQSPKEEFVMAEQWVQRPLKKGERYGFSVWLKADRPVRADVFLSSRAHDRNGKYLGATEKRSRHNITTSWAKYSTSIVMKAGEASDKDGLVAVVQLFEDPNTKVEMDDAELRFLGTAAE